MASSPMRRATFSSDGSSIIDRALGGRSTGPHKVSSSRRISCDQRRRENDARTSASSSSSRRGKLGAPVCVVFSTAPAGGSGRQGVARQRRSRPLLAHGGGRGRAGLRRQRPQGCRAGPQLRGTRRTARASSGGRDTGCRGAPSRGKAWRRHLLRVDLAHGQLQKACRRHVLLQNGQERALAFARA